MSTCLQVPSLRMMQKRRPWDFHMSFSCRVLIGLFSPSLKFSLVCSGLGRSGEMGSKGLRKGLLSTSLLYRGLACIPCVPWLSHLHMVILGYKQSPLIASESCENVCEMLTIEGRA